MTQKYFKIAELIYKQKSGIISEQEQKELYKWIQESISNRTLYDKLLKAPDWAQKYERYKQVSGLNVWSDLQQRISLRKRRTILKQMGYAAGIVLLLGIGFCLQQHIKNKENTLSFSSPVPGSRQAILRRRTVKMFC